MNLHLTDSSIDVVLAPSLHNRSEFSTQVEDDNLIGAKILMSELLTGTKRLAPSSVRSEAKA